MCECLETFNEIYFFSSTVILFRFEIKVALQLTIPNFYCTFFHSWSFRYNYFFIIFSSLFETVKVLFWHIPLLKFIKCTFKFFFMVILPPKWVGKSPPLPIRFECYLEIKKNYSYYYNWNCSLNEILYFKNTNN